MNSVVNAPPSMHPPIISANMGNMPPFPLGTSFTFDPKVNVLIGPNGVGKSTALRVFAGEEHKHLARVSEQTPEPVDPKVEYCDNIDEVVKVFVGATRASLTPDMALQDLRLQDIQGMLASVLRFGSLIVLGISFGILIHLVVATALLVLLQQPPEWLVVGRETWVMGGLIVVLNLFVILLSRMRRSPFILRLIPGSRLLSEALASRSEVSSIFLFQAVASINRRLLGVGDHPNRDRRSQMAQEAAAVALNCAKEIAPEVFPASAKLSSGTIISAEGTALNLQTRLRRGWLRLRWKWYFTDHLSIVDTNFSDNPLHITSLGAGTQNTLLIAWGLALSLVYAHDFRDGWQEQPAALFIDEIENHLHPEWQRRFISVLSEHFPGLQIFATTHSPFSVAGLKEGQVHRLSWVEEVGVVVESNEFEIVGWTADEIVSNFFGVRVPTDVETAQAVIVLWWLQSVGDLSHYESAEAWRKDVVEDIKEYQGLKHQLDSEGIQTFRWLTGEIGFPEPLVLPLVGGGESWRQEMIKDFTSYVGVDVISGGRAARQRALRLEQELSGNTGVLSFLGDAEVGDDQYA